MVFRRRDRRSWVRLVAESLWPRGGWGRAAQYIQHRLRRLPDHPHRIARGIFSGVLASFTPFYGLHFLTAAIFATIIRGNILASLLATFVGNPFTFPLIAAVSLKLGHWILGSRFVEGPEGTLMQKFSNAFGDLWHNFGAMFTPERAHWGGLIRFHHEVLLPYLVGGIIPGIIAALIAYYVSLPLIAAYQNRRKLKIKTKFEALKTAAKAAAKKKAPGPQS